MRWDSFEEFLQPKHCVVINGPVAYEGPFLPSLRVLAWSLLELSNGVLF